MLGEIKTFSRFCISHLEANIKAESWKSLSATSTSLVIYSLSSYKMTVTGHVCFKRSRK